MAKKCYSPWASKTAIDVNANGSHVAQDGRFAMHAEKRQAVMLDYTDSERGEGWSKSLIERDHVCLTSTSGKSSCVDLEILGATVLPEHPFLDMPGDGIVGLGLANMAISPLCSFFGRFVESAKEGMHQFGFSFASRGGEVHFGGFDESRFIAPLHWFELDDPAAGHWQVAIKSVRVGITVIDACEKGCHAVVDTGADLLGVRASNLPKFKALLAAHIEKEEGVANCMGEELIFDLGDFTLALPPSDYTNDECVPQLGQLNSAENDVSGIYAFGYPLLRHYYAAFDWKEKRIGFARTSGVLEPSIGFLGV